MRNVYKIRPSRAFEFLKNETQGRIISVYFRKRSNGAMRRMICRRDVRQHLRGGTLPYSASQHNLLPVFDMEKCEYRNVNLDGLVSFNIGGETFVIETWLS